MNQPRSLKDVLQDISALKEEYGSRSDTQAILRLQHYQELVEKAEAKLGWSKPDLEKEFEPMFSAYIARHPEKQLSLADLSNLPDRMWSGKGVRFTELPNYAHNQQGNINFVTFSPEDPNKLVPYTLGSQPNEVIYFTGNRAAIGFDPAQNPIVEWMPGETKGKPLIELAEDYTARRASDMKRLLDAGTFQEKPVMAIAVYQTQDDKDEHRLEYLKTWQDPHWFHPAVKTLGDAVWLPRFTKTGGDGIRAIKSRNEILESCNGMVVGG
jgi:hypothetical protein